MSGIDGINMSPVWHRHEISLRILYNKFSLHMTIFTKTQIRGSWVCLYISLPLTALVSKPLNRNEYQIPVTRSLRFHMYIEELINLRIHCIQFLFGRKKNKSQRREEMIKNDNANQNQPFVLNSTLGVSWNTWEIKKSYGNPDKLRNN